MVKEVEGTFAAPGGKGLYCKSWLVSLASPSPIPQYTNPCQPDTPPKAKLIFIHGFSDHINRYYDLFPYLASRGIEVHGFDQRGWGRSVSKPAERGLTGPTSQVLSDMVAFIKHHLPSPSSSHPPVFVMGHSMGGAQVLTLMADREGRYADLLPRIRGWLCEAPFIGLAPAEQPSALKVWGARLLGKVMPHAKMVHEIPPENLTRIPEVARSIKEDPLMHNTGTLEGLAGMLDRTEALGSGKARPAEGKVRSLWVGHGTADKGTDYGVTKKWFEECATGVEDRMFKSYEGAYHQLHADIGKEEFQKDVAEWILERCEEGPEVVAVEGALEQTTAGTTASKEAKSEVKGESKL
jgi:acylglycerol lipase